MKNYYRTENCIYDRLILKAYLLPTMIQIAVVAIAAAILKSIGVQLGYASIPGIVLVAVGGISSALWGAVYQCRHKGKSVKQVVTDFFNIRQPIKMYALAVMFVLIDFTGGTLALMKTVQILFFMMGLLTNCFILSCLFKVTGSLWICVMTHAIINMGSQMAVSDNDVVSVAAKAVCIVIAIIISKGFLTSEDSK